MMTNWYRSHEQTGGRKHLLVGSSPNMGQLPLLLFEHPTILAATRCPALPHTDTSPSAAGQRPPICPLSPPLLRDLLCGARARGVDAVRGHHHTQKPAPRPPLNHPTRFNPPSPPPPRNLTFGFGLHAAAGTPRKLDKRDACTWRVHGNMLWLRVPLPRPFCVRTIASLRIGPSGGGATLSLPRGCGRQLCSELHGALSIITAHSGSKFGLDTLHLVTTCRIPSPAQSREKIAVA
eukprot:gene14897-biopygen23143